MIKDYYEASRDLTGNGLKLYCYLYQNIEETKNTEGTCLFSKHEFALTYNIPDIMANHTFKELNEKGYLVKQKDGTYIFIPHPTAPSIEFIKKENKKQWDYL